LFVLTPALHPNEGGVQTSTCKLGRHFLKLGYDVSVFSFAHVGHSQSEPLRLFCSQHPGGHHLAANLQELQATIDHVQPDIVINQMPYEHKIGQVLQENKRYLLLGCLRNTLYSVRANPESYVARTAPKPLNALSGSFLLQRAFSILHRMRHRADLKRILETYDFFVMFGPPNLEELRYFLPGFDRDKIRLIPNSIPAVADVPPEKQNRLLWLGRVSHEQKRAGLILPIWQQVSQRLPGWILDVVGDGPLLERLRSQAGEMRLQRIHFHGRQVPDDFYSRAAIFFMTSAFEGFPNALIEAQGHGAIPIVFDSYPVARWIVDDGINGHLVEPFDVDGMATKIIELANHPQRRQFAEQALESARRFQVDRVGRMWRDLFLEEAPKRLHRHNLEKSD
jgi:glycosyltransferase involved in cell wall biosynthesis